MRRLVPFVAAALLLSAPALAQQKYSFTMTTAVPEGSTLYTGMTVPYVEAVRSLCGGQVEIKPFGAGVLLDSARRILRCRTAALELATRPRSG